MRFTGVKVEVAAAAFGVKAVIYSDRLQQSGFADPVFSNKKGDVGSKLKSLFYAVKILYNGKPG